MNSILRRSATHQVSLLANKEISSVELTMMYIAQIEQWHTNINSMVVRRFEEALEEARWADENRQQRPLHGIPCSIKECFAVTGMPQTSGLPSRIGLLAKTDAPAVKRYREAGAIPMGVTNTSELCMWMESSNTVYGRSSNPYDSRCTVGGSSGGEGAIVASACAPFGLGSDIGGSIRIPAFFNGVFGHKPSSLLVPNEGQYPIAEKAALRYLCTGPLCHHAEDLWLLLPILAGEKANRLKRDPSLEPKALRVLNVVSNGRSSVSLELRKAQERVVSFFVGQGAEILDIQPRSFRHSAEIWMAMLNGAGGEPFHSLLLDDSLKRALLRKMLGRSPHTTPALALSLLEKISKPFDSLLHRYHQEGIELKMLLDSLLDERTILLFPSYTTTAPKHRSAYLRPIDWEYTAIMNVMELPVTQIPMGLGTKGLPLGVQVVAGHGYDHLCLYTAGWLEKQFGGWVPPMID